MERLCLCALGLALAAMTVPPAAAETHPFSVLDMLAMDRISDPRLAPDGGRLAFTVRRTDMEANKGRLQVWVARLDGSDSRSLTSGEANSQQARWSADGGALYFLSTRGGSSQVWKLRLDGGEAEQVTRLPLEVGAFEPTPDGRRLILGLAVFPNHSPEQTKARLDEVAQSKASGRSYERLFVRHWDSWKDGTRNHLFAYELDSGAIRDLMPALDADCPTLPFGDTGDFTISPDGGTVVFSARDVGREEAWSTNFDLFAVPADGSAAPTRLTSNPAWDAQPRFSPDGRTLAYLAMDQPGYEADRYHFVLRDWATGNERSIDLRADASPTGDRSPNEFCWSADGSKLLATAAHVGQVALFEVELATGSCRWLAGDGSVVAPQALPGGGVLFARHSLLGPAELYTLAAGATDPRRVTQLNDAKVAAARFGRPEQFHFSGAGGDRVYGWLVRPVDFDAARKYPVAFLIHGGPQGSFNNEFHYRWNPQAYAGAGYAAVMIDFHGSTGYGQAFTDAIQDDWGGAPYQDLMLGLDHALASYPFLDRDRIAALGGSYGAYMVHWIAGQTDRFRCLVSHDGNLDERAAYFMTEELWFPEHDHRGTPWDHPEGYAKHNPVEHVAKWKTPMLVIHGQNDFRIPYSQGLATFNALQRRGIPSQLLFFPDENHWVLKPHNSKQWYDTVLAWLARWLGAPVVEYELE